eukprot:snap_masked-scaffold_25-processed-gene-1.4-mRNA-1 protein AED:1.00 eAED:1.00 QI:0/0/0/0/1/1/2/0/237
MSFFHVIPPKEEARDIVLKEYEGFCKRSGRAFNTMNIRMIITPDKNVLKDVPLVISSVIKYSFKVEEISLENISKIHGVAGICKSMNFFLINLIIGSITSFGFLIIYILTAVFWIIIWMIISPRILWYYTWDWHFLSLANRKMDLVQDDGVFLYRLYLQELSSFTLCRRKNIVYTPEKKSYGVFSQWDEVYFGKRIFEFGDNFRRLFISGESFILPNSTVECVTRFKEEKKSFSLLL